MTERSEGIRRHSRPGHPPTKEGPMTERSEGIRRHGRPRHPPTEEGP